MIVLKFLSIVPIRFPCGISDVAFQMALTGKLTKKLVENLGAGRHGDGGGLYLVVDPSGARRWIVRVVLKGQRKSKGAQWINTLRDYAFPKIGRMPVDSIGQPEMLMCLSPIWTDTHETARRLAQWIKIVLDVAKSKGFRSGENPVTAIHEAQVLPKVKATPKHHNAMHWQEVPAFYADLETRDAIAAKA